MAHPAAAQRGHFGPEKGHRTLRLQGKIAAVVQRPITTDETAATACFLASDVASARFRQSVGTARSVRLTVEAPTPRGSAQRRPLPEDRLTCFTSPVRWFSRAGRPRRARSLRRGRRRRSTARTRRRPPSARCEPLGTPRPTWTPALQHRIVPPVSGRCGTNG